jgi:hypothetical protein
MRDLASAVKRPAFAAAFGIACALLGLGQPAYAANPLELNFGLFGPSYEGRVAPCESAMGTITNQFWEKESTFWNSALKITGYSDIHEIAFRPWQSDNIPRRYCAGHVMLSDGQVRGLYYSIIEDGGFASFGQGVEWCVTGLDRNWAYNPGCRAARP